jgi:Divergent InlB B-repeat domain/Fibronectin type III domain/Bacterial Ig domain
MKAVDREVVWDAVRRAVVGFLLLGSLMVASFSSLATQSVTIAWDPSPDTNVVGYKIYYGVVSRTYTNVIDVGASTSATISNLVEGTTYYFAATAYNVLGMESAFSGEASYTVPGVGNQPPTLDPLNDLALNENAGQQTVNLSGISSGSTNENQTLTVTAASSNPGLIPNPSVTYSSPNTTGTLKFTPAANASGSATITVTVNDGGASNNIISRAFLVTVNWVNQTPTLDPLGNRTVNENAGQQTVNLSGITSGAINENQVLTVTATSGNPGLIPNPSVTYSSPSTTGTLKFTPAANAHGSATITVTVNDGGASNNIISRAFTVTVNSPPTITAIPDQTIATNSSTGALAFVIGDVETSAGSLTLQAASSATGLIPVNRIVFGGSGANRTATLTPLTGQTGTATITITVSDGTASTSTSFHLTVLGPPTPPGTPQIVISGQGSLSPALDPQKLTIGQTYTVTAIPDAGQTFAGWTGTYNSANPQLTFLMTSNLFLQANFKPADFTPSASTFSGLFYQNDQVRLSQAGFFRITTTKQGRYSGYLRIGARRYPVSGKLDAQGQTVKTIARARQSSLTLNLAVGTDQVSGYVTNADWVATLAGDRAVFNGRTNPAPFAGKFTLVIPGLEGDPSSPAGHGFGAVRVNASGSAHVAGVLADGTRFSQSAPVSRNGSWPFYAPLYSGNGLVLSWLAFTNQSDSDLNGLLTWIKSPNAKARYYPSGFDNQSQAAGSIYVLPAGANILNLTSAELEVSGGNLASIFTNSVTLGRRNTVTAADKHFSMRFASTSGLYRGRLRDPETGKMRAFRGAVLQKVNVAYGFMLGESQSSAVVLQP